MYHVLFDIDGTLLLSGNAGGSAIEKALRINFGIDQPARVPIHGQTDRGIAQSFFEKHEIENNEESWQKFYKDYLSHLPDSLKECQGEVLPGCREILNELHKRDDVTLGLLTGNTQRSAYLKLSYYELDDFFLFGGFGDQHPSRNDVAKQAIESVKESTGINPDPAKTWVIGDTPNDIKCARAIEANVLAVATGSFSVEQLTEHQPDVCLENLAQWEQAIEVMLGS